MSNDAKPQQTPQQGTYTAPKSQGFNQYKGTKNSQSGSCGKTRGK